MANPIPTLRMEGNAFQVLTPYNQQFVESLKEMVDPDYREYDPQTHVWTIHDPEMYEPILELVEGFFGKAVLK